MKIYCYRHGQTTYNKSKIVQGRGVDSDLNEHGQAQARAFFDHYKDQPFERLLTSTLKRTQQTAAPFEALGIPTERHESLDEISWGIWEGQHATAEMHEEYLDLMDAWRAGDYQYASPEADSALDMQQRLQPFLAALQEAHQAGIQQLLVCSHGGTLGFIMTLLQGEPLSAMPQYKHHNTGLTVFDYDGATFRLLEYNHTEHLEALRQADQ